VHPILDIVKLLHVLSFTAYDYHYMKYWYKRNKFYIWDKFIFVLQKYQILHLVVSLSPKQLYHTFHYAFGIILQQNIICTSDLSCLNHSIRKILYLYVWWIFLWKMDINAIFLYLLIYLCYICIKSFTCCKKL